MCLLSLLCLVAAQAGCCMVCSPTCVIVLFEVRKDLAGTHVQGQRLSSLGSWGFKSFAHFLGLGRPLDLGPKTCRQTYFCDMVPCSSI